MNRPFYTGPAILPPGKERELREWIGEELAADEAKKRKERPL